MWSGDAPGERIEVTPLGEAMSGVRVGSQRAFARRPFPCPPGACGPGNRPVVQRGQSPPWPWEALAKAKG